MFVVDRLKLLGLNSREIRVFTALSTFGRMNMALLAARCSLPRTTVNCVVARLIDQGLIDVFQVKRHKEYQVDLARVTSLLADLGISLVPESRPFDAENPQRTTGDKTQIQNMQMTKNSSFESGVGENYSYTDADYQKDTKGGANTLSVDSLQTLASQHPFSVLNNFNALEELFYESVQQWPEEPVYLVCSSASFRQFLQDERDVEREGFGLFSLIHLAQTAQAHTPLHVVITKNTLDECATLSLEALERLAFYAGLLSTVTVVPQSCAAEGTDMLVCKHAVALYSPEAGTGVCIADPAAVKVLGGIAQSAVHTGATCAFGTHLSALIEKSVNS